MCRANFNCIQSTNTIVHPPPFTFLVQSETMHSVHFLGNCIRSNQWIRFQLRVLFDCISSSGRENYLNKLKIKCISKIWSIQMCHANKWCMRKLENVWTFGDGVLLEIIIIIWSSHKRQTMHNTIIFAKHIHNRVIDDPEDFALLLLENNTYSSNNNKLELLSDCWLHIRWRKMEECYCFNFINWKTSDYDSFSSRHAHKLQATLECLLCIVLVWNANKFNFEHAMHCLISLHGWLCC